MTGPEQSSGVARHPLFFMHISRTGGTSLMQFLDRQFSPAEICPAHKHLEFVELEQQNGLLGYSFYRGHFGADLPKRVDPNGRIITFLRRPTTRLFSRWRHLRSHPIPFEGKSGPLVAEHQAVPIAAHQFDFEDFCYAVMKIEGPWFFNSMTALCGSWDISLSNQRELLGKAKLAIDSFEFVGFTETLNESVAQLQRQFGWALEPIGRYNAAPELPLPQNEKFLRWLKFAVRLDEELYDYALQTRQTAIASAWPSNAAPVASGGRAAAGKPR
jgi:hypothetical protein